MTNLSQSNLHFPSDVKEQRFDMDHRKPVNFKRNFGIKNLEIQIQKNGTCRDI